MIISRPFSEWNSIASKGVLNNKHAKFPQCHQQTAISRPSSQQSHDINSKSHMSQETWTISVQGTVFPSVCDIQPFYNHLPGKSLSTRRSLSPGRPEQWMCRIFPSVIEEQPFQDHLLSKILLTPRALCPSRPEQYPPELFPSVCWGVSLFDTISGYNPTDLKSSFLAGLNSNCAKSLPQYHHKVATPIMIVHILCIYQWTNMTVKLQM